MTAEAGVRWGILFAMVSQIGRSELPILKLWAFMIPPKKLVVNIKNKKIRKEIKIPHHAEGDGDIRTVEGFGIGVAICCVKRYNINRKKTSAE